MVGPTATGKSALAVALARATGSEVANADAMSLYRGMDIGTATPTRPEQEGVPHHLFGLWDVGHTASVAEYQQVARSLVDRLHASGIGTVLVGGSGLYVRAVLDELAFPGTDPTVRARLEEDLARLGAAAMHRRLTEVDPAAAAAILPSNGRRVVRALEVVEITGAPYVATLPAPVAHYEAVQVGLDLPGEVLEERISRRADLMWEQGLVAEVAALREAGLEDSPTASRAVGYKEVLALLAGKLGEREAKEATVRATRRLARRQRAWFRRDPRIHWLRADREDLLTEALRLAAPTIEV